MTTIDLATTPRRRARDAIVTIGLAAVLLVAAAGGSIRKQGDEMRPGLLRDLVRAVGAPAGWVADQLPIHSVVHDATAFLSPDENLSGGKGAFGGGAISVARGTGAAIPAISADDFDLSAIGAAPKPTQRLRTLLVTGDSLPMPLDSILARRLTSKGVKTTRDPHVGTGISKSELLDWGKLAVRQAKSKPDAVVVFIGANEGFDMHTAAGKRVVCCGIDWAVEYATRTRAIMSVYRRDGAARVYWLTVPTPRDRARAEVERLVNQSLTVAAAPYRAQVRVLDTVPILTPGDRFRTAMTVGDRERVVRAPDGIHLNDTGSGVAADLVVEALHKDFVLP